MESVLVAVGNYSVACVGTTVKAGTNVVIFRQNIDEFSFAFIAPLRAENDGKFRFFASDAGLRIFAN